MDHEVSEAIEHADPVRLRRRLDEDPTLAHAVDDAGRGLVHHLVDAITTHGSIPLVRSDAHRPLLDAAVGAGAPLDVADHSAGPPTPVRTRS